MTKYFVESTIFVSSVKINKAQYRISIFSLNSINIYDSEKNAWRQYIRAANILWILSLWNPTAIEERVTR